MGEGTQPLPWIHVKDLSGLVKHSVENENVEGIYNAVAPQVIGNFLSLIFQFKTRMTISIKAKL